jgi:methenyltetrahydrofolate cyclohydrolase
MLQTSQSALPIRSEETLMSTEDMTIAKFLAARPARKTGRGGGAAAAVTGAQAAALVSMVINFTLGNPKYAAVEAAMQQYLSQSEALRVAILAQADQDIEAFNAVAAGYALPRSTDAEKAARSAAIQTALKGATEVPFALAEQCVTLMRLIQPVASQGNVNVVSDAATALHLAQAAFNSALVNVNINLKALKDEKFVAAATARRVALVSEAAQAHAAAQAACALTLGMDI